MVHVSRNPVLVPVFTAAGNGTSNGVTPPKPGMRASGSLRMSVTRYACSALSTRRAATGVLAKTMRPAASRTRSIANGSASMPRAPKCGRVEERHKRRPGLARRPHHVDLAAVRGVAIGRAPDPGDDPTGPGLDRHKRRVGRFAIVQCLEPQPHQALRFRLQTCVERRFDDQTIAPGEIR